MIIQSPPIASIPPPQKICDLENPIVEEGQQQQQRPQELIDDQMERYSETSSIELVIQGGPNEPLNCSAPIMKIPDSHNFNFNPYPGVKHQGHVPIDIVKSFTPVAHSEQPKNEEGAEIYNDYVHDPYNLTLQMNSNSSGSNLMGSQVPPNPTSTFFQSSSYFSNDTSDLIPSAPGSELFNRP